MLSISINSQDKGTKVLEYYRKVYSKGGKVYTKEAPIYHEVGASWSYLDRCELCEF